MVHTIAVVALEDSAAFDLGIPSQAFGSALDENGEPFYRVLVCSVDGSPVSTTAGFAAAVEHNISILETADTIIVAPGSQARETRAETINPRLASALLAASARGARMVSICTGAFVLASLGLLDGKRATTYWRRTELFREAFPRVHLEPDVLFVDDGVLTSAGVAAGLDLCLHIIRTDLGIAAANAASRSLVSPPTRLGGQAQYIERQRVFSSGDAMSVVLAWAAGHLEGPISVDSLAARAMMSPRTFTRRFREHTGTSPVAWITTERLARARELLETTDLYVDEIATLSGLGTATHLRAQFQRRFEQSPTEYRRVFRPASA